MRIARILDMQDSEIVSGYCYMVMPCYMARSTTGQLYYVDLTSNIWGSLETIECGNAKDTGTSPYHWRMVFTRPSEVRSRPHSKRGSIEPWFRKPEQTKMSLGLLPFRTPISIMRSLYARLNYNQLAQICPCSTGLQQVTWGEPSTVALGTSGLTWHFQCAYIIEGLGQMAPQSYEMTTERQESSWTISLRWSSINRPQCGNPTININKP